MPTPKQNAMVIDLFSGVGGLSLGAARAGFRVAVGVELDKIAAKSHADNFPQTKHFDKDVGQLDGSTLLEVAGLKQGQLTGLIGGPPCQGFSLIGKRQETDPRNNLFGHFFRLVTETRPAFFLAENVLGILSANGGSMIEQAMGVLPKNYIVLPPIRVEAHRYGAPTTRTRVFFIGYDPDRIDALTAEHFLPDAAVEEVRVKHALAGLPGVKPDWQSEPQSWRKVGHLPASTFTRRVVGMIPPGVGHRESVRRAANGEVSGFLGTRHTEETAKRFATLKPGQIDSVYRSPRLKPYGFCPTLRAGTGPERGSFQAVRPIHPTAPRVISPREAARLQGFPDWFVFNPTKWHSFRQIGNSVSPLIAEALLTKIYANL